MNDPPICMYKQLIPHDHPAKSECHLSEKNLVGTFKYSGGKSEKIKQCEGLSNLTTNTLCFYTQNIWFESYNMQERFDNLFQLMLDSQADFICLQEVTHQFRDTLFQDARFAEYYISGNLFHCYGCLILSKYPANFYDFEFEDTRMDRNCLIAELVVNGKFFYVATSHLESMNSAKRRAKQVDYIQNELLFEKQMIFMGDFNFDYKWDTERNHFDWDKFIDIWEELKDPSDQSYTMPNTPYWPAVTFDHIILTKSCQFEQRFIERVGNYCCRNFDNSELHEIQNDNIVRTPSDHLGLFADIVLKE